jgi:hypothetical protein
MEGAGCVLSFVAGPHWRERCPRVLAVAVATASPGRRMVCSATPNSSAVKVSSSISWRKPPLNAAIVPAASWAGGVR